MVRPTIIVLNDREMGKLRSSPFDWSSIETALNGTLEVSNQRRLSGTLKRVHI